MKEKIKELMKNGKVSSVLLVNFHGIEENFYYYTETPFGAFEGNALILGGKGKPLLLTTKLDYGQIKGNSKLRVKLIESKKQYLELLAKNLKGKKIGCNFELMPVNFRKRLVNKLKGKKLIDVSKVLREVRAEKTKEETKMIKKACVITQKILNEVPKIVRQNMKKGLTEKKLAVILEEMIIEKGAQGLSFPTIVASGKSGAVPHHVTSNKKISRGFLLIDFGIKIENYCSDLSRTFFVGKAGKKEKELYELVSNVKERSEKMTKAGVVCEKVFDEAERLLKENGFELIHGLGHGIGLKVHDEPKGFLKGNKKKIKTKNVLTVEPGVYGNFGGIRIEDIIVVKEKGIEKLSSAPKKLVEIRI